MANLQTLFSKYHRLVLFDTETTGLQYSRDEIIEFAAIAVESVDGVPTVVREYDELVALSPGGFVPPKIEALTGISTQDLRERGLPKTRVCRDIAELISGNTLLLAYNAHFDLSWLLPFVSQDGIKACEAWLDSFPSWDAFVEGSFLQDFVHSTSGGYGMPRELWRGHFSGHVMPQGDQREAFFTNASAWISARGARLAIALEKRRSAAGHTEEGRAP